MTKLTRNLQIMGAALFLGLSLPAFAESAPVFDADAMQGDMDPSQDLPPPPPPDNAFGPAPQANQFSQQTHQQQFAPPAQAEMDPQPIRLSMDQRIQRVEQQINNMQNSDSAQRVEALQNQIQALRSQLEELTHQLDQIQNQHRAAIADLDKRVSQHAAKPTQAANATTDNANVPDTFKQQNASLTQKPNLTPSAPTAQPPAAVKTADATPPTQPNVAEEQQIYQTAYNLIKSKKYNDAVKALQGMLSKYPTGQFASNAHYWLGELYGLMGKNDQALTEFSSVVKTYPDSPRVSDAQLKVGLILAAQFKWVEAKDAFKQVINHYPGTSSSRLAAEQIKQIKQAGH